MVCAKKPVIVQTPKHHRLYVDTSRKRALKFAHSLPKVLPLTPTYDVFLEKERQASPLQGPSKKLWRTVGKEVTLEEKNEVGKWSFPVTISLFRFPLWLNTSYHSQEEHLASCAMVCHFWDCVYRKTHFCFVLSLWLIFLALVFTLQWCELPRWSGPWGQ